LGPTLGIPGACNEDCQLNSHKLGTAQHDLDTLGCFTLLSVLRNSVKSGRTMDATDDATGAGVNGVNRTLVVGGDALKLDELGPVVINSGV
jgi:hypothetical protein